MRFSIGNSAALWLLCAAHFLEGSFLGIFAGVALSVIHLFLELLRILLITKGETG